MSKAVKTKIYQMPEGIEDESVLNQVMEEVAFYAPDVFSLRLQIFRKPKTLELLS